MIPKHIAIVLDGNRRYARSKSLIASKGHEHGAEKVKELINWCSEYDISELTLYALSTKNYLNRSKTELDFLFSMFRSNFSKLLDNKQLAEKGIKVDFIGRVDKLPDDLKKLSDDLVQQTKDNKNLVIHFAIMYDGREEIISAAKKCVKDGIEINEPNIQKNLYLSSEPDLLIRTGEQRLSGFLLWQSSYSEIVFLSDVMWPEFKKEDFIGALEEFSRRKRNFGK